MCDKFPPAGLLRVVEALIERRAGVGDVLECGAGFRHALGAPCEPVERRGGRRLVLLIGPGPVLLNLLEVELCGFTQRLLVGRPVFGLIGRQFKTGPERRDPGVGEGRQILNARTMPVLEAPLAVVAGPAGVAGMLLRIHDRRAGDRKSCRRDYHGLPHDLLQRDVRYGGE